MLLTHETTIVLNKNDANIVGHMCYAAYKLWNVCNYERTNYKNLGLEKYPDWYYQKSKHKDDLWFKSLPSQTAQEICKLLDKSWKSFYRLKESGGIGNPGSPRYKKDKMPITYMQNGIQHETGSFKVRLSLPKKLKEYMAHTYDIRAAYLYLKNPVFSNNDFCVGAFSMEYRGVEPLASTMRMLRAPNCANTPYGPGGNRTRVQKPIPCTSTIIVSSFSFPLPHGN